MTKEAERIISFENLAFLVCCEQHKMTENQRIQFWEVIQSAYCRNCGTETATEGNRCHCNDDE